MKNRLRLIQTYLRLGLLNLVRVFWYRLQLRFGVLEKRLPIRSEIEGEFFSISAQTIPEKSPQKLKIEERFLLFGWLAIDTTTLPDWHQSVLTGLKHNSPYLHWTKISDFDSGVGDIKGIWELSRFTWVLQFIQNYLATNDTFWLEKSNQWISNWCANNRANQGVNWKCAQETSLRLLHLASAAMLIQEKSPSKAMQTFVQQHIERILPTLSYAKAQDNNHGTSEAAALIVGASWLLQSQPDNKQAVGWYELGRRYLVNRVNRLILPDGTFSQYSVTYHRLMLDTLCFVELWRQFLNLKAFPQSTVIRLGQASEWLFRMVDEKTGDAPNLGANDGAHILNFSACKYRDFRPSTELGCRLFLGKHVFDVTFPEQIEACLGPKGDHLSRHSVSVCREGGFAFLRSKDAFCCLNIPVFVFRPSQSDIMHLDFWVDGTNVLRDAGSYSYNTEQKWLEYFPSAEAHNTVQFDNREPMPKLSRFLYANWPRYQMLDSDKKSVISSYQTYFGAYHKREVTLVENSLIITDKLRGVRGHARLRWRLPQLEWEITDQEVYTESLRIRVTCDKSLKVFRLAEGFESRYYGKRTSIPVLEATVDKDAEIITTINWQ